MNVRSELDTTKIKRYCVASMMVVGLLCLAVLGIGSDSAEADTMSTGLSAAYDKVSLDPQFRGIEVSESLMVTVRAVAPIGIKGVQYRICFNPDVLEVVDANPVTTDTVEIHPAAAFTGPGQNEVDNLNGVISYGATLVAGDPLYGLQELGRIEFRAKAQGRSAVTFDRNQSWLAGADLLPVPDTVWKDGLITAGTQRVYLPIVYNDGK